MPLNDNGDIIKGLGFVALYAAYLEEAVDECLEVLFTEDQVQFNQFLKRPTSQKIKFLQDRIVGFVPLPDELASFPEDLAAVGDLLEERNLVIHGRVYAILGVGDVRLPGRRDIPAQPATSAELYALANDLFAALSHLRNASMFALPRLLLHVNKFGA